MGCSTITLKGMALECLATNGGVKNVYFVEHGKATIEDTVVETAETTGNHTINASDITMADSTKFIAYHFAKHQGSLTTTTGESNGNKYWQSTLALQFNRMEGKKHLEIQALALGELDALIEDYNGKVWFIGYDGYLSETAGNTTAQTGTATDDLNGYTISLTARNGYLPFEVKIDGSEATAFAALISEPANA